MKAIELKFNSATTVHFWPFEGYDESASYGVIFYEKKDGLWIESMNEPLRFQPYHWFSFFRRFFHEMKAELIAFDEESGVKVIATDFFDPRGKDVKVCLDTEDRHEAFIWIEQAMEFAENWRCRLTIQCDQKIAERAAPIYGESIFEQEGKDFYATYHIGRYDIKEEGINRYGAQAQSKGWVNGGFKFFRSFANPRDWKFLHSEQIARDILGLSDTQAWSQRYVDSDWFINTLQIKDDQFEIKR